MRTTSIPLILSLVVLGGALGWSAVSLFDTFALGIGAVPWSAAGGLLFFAGLVFGGAWYMYDRVHRRGRGVEALMAVRLLLLGKASALVAAVAAGGYAGYGVHTMLSAVAGAADDRVLRAFVAAGAALLVVVGSLLLERACRVPPSDDDERPGLA